MRQTRRLTALARNDPRCSGGVPLFRCGVGGLPNVARLTSVASQIDETASLGPRSACGPWRESC